MSFQAIQKNLSDIERKLGKANKIAAKGDGISYKDSIKLARKSNSIISTIKKGIKEYGSFEPSEDEAKKLLAQMSRIVDMTEEQLSLLVKDQAHLNKLKVGGLVKRSVGKTQATSKELSDVMVSKAPGSVKGDAEKLEGRRNAAFEKATTAFAGETGGEEEGEGEDDSD
ncbi:MAG: hypothetical protein M1822_007232 [Bathelium mastoideum]|nr:MAG: hypothetical protein M1822_007232 [Bathelium mastoideum]